MYGRCSHGEDAWKTKCWHSIKKNELFCLNGFCMSGSKPRRTQTNDWNGGWLCRVPVSLTLLPPSPYGFILFKMKRGQITIYSSGPDDRGVNPGIWAKTAHLLSFLMGTLALPPKSVSCSQFSRWRGYSQRWRSQQTNSECVCISLTESPCGDRPKPDG